MKREELEKACKKIRKVRTRMVMMWVIDTAGTTPVRRVKWCKPTQVCPDCVAFLGSAVPERPSCVVPAAAFTGLDRLPGDKPDGFATWTALCPKKSLLPGAAGKASLHCGPTRVNTSCRCGIRTRSKPFGWMQISKKFRQ